MGLVMDRRNKKDKKGVIHEVYCIHKAVARGDSTAQNELGQLYEIGSKFIEQNGALAAHWYRKAAMQGDKKAQSNLGNLYLFGVGVKQNSSKAVIWFMRAANQGLIEAQIKLALIYSGDDNPSVEQSFYWHYRAAREGDAGGQYFTAYKYFMGFGVQQDFKLALEWYLKAANNTDRLYARDAMFDLGTMYDNGLGVEYSETRGFYWFKKAAELDEIKSQAKVAEKFELGLGVNQSDEQAFHWYHRAAEQSCGSSQLALYKTAKMYENGEGVQRDQMLALYWYRRAANQGVVVPKEKLLPKLELINKVKGR